MDAVELQAQIDQLHGQAIGECDGCDVDTNGEPSHKLSCSFLYTKAGAAARAALLGY